IMQEVQALCDQVIIINKGRIVADDPIERLQHKVSEQTLTSVEFLQAVDAGILQKIGGVKSVRNIGKNRWQLISENNRDVRAEVFKFAVSNNLTLLELHKE